MKRKRGDSRWLIYFSAFACPIIEGLEIGLIAFDHGMCFIRSITNSCYCELILFELKNLVKAGNTMRTKSVLS